MRSTRQDRRCARPIYASLAIVKPALADVVLLINPAAGRGRGARVGAVVAQDLRSRGLDVQVVIGACPAESAQQAVRSVAAGCGALVVCGGDGIVHLTLNAVAGTTVPLGVVPAGSGNDFARSLGSSTE